MTQWPARGEEPCPSPIQILIDRYLRDETEHSTGNLVHLHHHHACSTDRFFGHDWLFATQPVP
jgi:hypothetical protein